MYNIELIQCIRIKKKIADLESIINSVKLRNTQNTINKNIFGVKLLFRLYSLIKRATP